MKKVKKNPGSILGILILGGLVLWAINKGAEAKEEAKAKEEDMVTKTEIREVKEELKTATDKVSLEQTKLYWDTLYETRQITQTEYTEGIKAYLAQLALLG